MIKLTFNESLMLSDVMTKKLKFLYLAISTAVVTTFVIINQAIAFQVEVTPLTPRLGDTIKVIVQSNDPNPPKVNMGQQTYPTFAIKANQYRAFIPTTPLDKPGSLSIRVEGSENKTLNLSLGNRSFPVQRIRISGRGAGKASELELSRVAEFRKLVTPEKFWNGPFIAPNRARITTGYGIRRYYNGVFAKDYFHRGLDYGGNLGSPVVAPAPGRIALVGREADGFYVHGNTVGIDHGQGVLSIMLHLNSIRVQEGDFVKTGQILGTVGSTGASTGPHLHWGLYVNGKSIDPAPWRNQNFQ